MPDDARTLAQKVPLLDGRNFGRPEDWCLMTNLRHIKPPLLTPSSAFPGISLRPDGIDTIRTIDNQMGADA